MKRVLPSVFMLVLCLAAMPADSLAKSAQTKAVASVVQSIELGPSDNLFLALRDATRNGNASRVKQLTAQLADYDIPSYVDYYRLKTGFRAASEADIREYLKKYQGSAIADRLRNDWLLELGRKGNWTLFDEQYPQFALDDDLALKCYHLSSKILKGRRVTDDARALLVTPREYGEACAGLIGLLAEKKQFSEADLWYQLRLASESGASAQMRRLAPLLNISPQLIGQVIDSAIKVMLRGPGSSRFEHEIYILALGRVARASNSGPVQAQISLENALPKLSSSEKAQAWAQIALPSAQNLARDVMDFWKASKGAALSPEAAQWKVRSALRAGNFAIVRQTIEAMPADLRDDPAWVYWLARALIAESGNGEIPQAARALLTSISDQFHFYGQLAREELGEKIVIPATADKPTQEELQQIANNSGFKHAMKFFALGLRFEGVREWNWQLRGMSERQLLAAAEFARQNNLLDRMVNTSDRTTTEFDFHQRFPTPHLDVMQDVASKIGVDKAWAYGLIRQESRFMLQAKSSVGASGLMQLMPATARWVAKKIGMQSFAHHQVNEIETNITLGVNYLNIVIQGLDGSQTMASAGYNAGPGRPKNWRSSLEHTVEGAIFAESIPFLETRTYVKNVLSNATYYAAIFEKKPQSLKARLGMVSP